MQAYWNRFAFVRLVLIMALGIITAYLSNESPLPFIILLVGCFFGYFLLLSIKPSLLPYWKAVALGFSAFLICFSVGYINTYQQAEKYAPNHLLNFQTEHIEAAKLVLDSKRTVTEKSYGFTAQLVAAKLNGSWKAVAGKSRLYFEQSEKTEVLQYGDELLVASGLTIVQAPRNPFEFDYQAYLGLSQVYFQQYVKADKVHLLDSNKGNIVMAASYKASHYLSQQLRRYITNEQSYAIANALTLGIKDDLDNDLKAAYAAAGAMHVLAVSGLHVGIIFMIVAFIFKPWRNQKWGRWAYAASSLFVLWSFAFITGLSPSVMRAATMFSVVVLAQASRRHTNIYNTLASSAFLLLLIDPYLLFSVGFQLSYLAVFGIVYFQPKIQLLLPVKNRWLDKLWILTSVSIAAQLVTAPLGMLYFHQFPTYFFLSNIIVIPAAFVILNGSLLLMLLSFWVTGAIFLGKLMSFFIVWVNKAIFYLEQLPYSTVEGINFTSTETALMYIILLIIALFVAHKSFALWKILFVSVILLSASVAYRQFTALDTDQLMVHSLSKESALSYIKNGEAYIYSSAVDSVSLNYHVFPYIQATGSSINSIDSSFLSFPLRNEVWNDLNLLEWHGKSILHFHKGLQMALAETGEVLNIDYLILSNNVWQESSVIFELFSPQLVIIDGSNSSYHIHKLQLWLNQRSIKYYTVPEQGAFEFKI